mmetsp:Transcript_20866/g.53002  ORF Transcript_20866/g.53002 Transcript_20866/m.53002 type:complete len:219 (+) Transcript_20866:931-1587(+)
MGFFVQNLDHHITPPHDLHGNASCLDDVPLLDLFADLCKPHEHFHFPHQPPELSSTIESEVERCTPQLVSEIVNVALEILKLFTGKQVSLVVGPPTLVKIMKRNELLLQSLPPFLGGYHSFEHEAEGVAKRYPHIPDHGDDGLGVTVAHCLLQRILLGGHLVLELSELLDHRLDRIRKLRLNLALHELREIVKSYHLLKLGRNISLPRLGQIRCCTLP